MSAGEVVVVGQAGGVLVAGQPGDVEAVVAQLRDMTGEVSASTLSTNVIDLAAIGTTIRAIAATHGQYLRLTPRSIALLAQHGPAAGGADSMWGFVRDSSGRFAGNLDFQKVSLGPEQEAVELAWQRFQARPEVTPINDSPITPSMPVRDPSGDRKQSPSSARGSTPVVPSLLRTGQADSRSSSRSGSPTSSRR